MDIQILIKLLSILAFVCCCTVVSIDTGYTHSPTAHNTAPSETTPPDASQTQDVTESREDSGVKVQNDTLCEFCDGGTSYSCICESNDLDHDGEGVMIILYAGASAGGALLIIVLVIITVVCCSKRNKQTKDRPRPAPSSSELTRRNNDQTNTTTTSDTGSTIHTGTIPPGLHKTTTTSANGSTIHTSHLPPVLHTVRYNSIVPRGPSPGKSPQLHPRTHLFHQHDYENALVKDIIDAHVKPHVNMPDTSADDRALYIEPLPAYCHVTIPRANIPGRIPYTGHVKPHVTQSDTNLYARASYIEPVYEPVTIPRAKLPGRITNTGHVIPHVTQSDTSVYDRASYSESAYSHVNISRAIIPSRLPNAGLNDTYLDMSGYVGVGIVETDHPQESTNPRVPITSEFMQSMYRFRRQISCSFASIRSKFDKKVTRVDGDNMSDVESTVSTSRPLGTKRKPIKTPNGLTNKPTKSRFHRKEKSLKGINIPKSSSNSKSSNREDHRQVTLHDETRPSVRKLGNGNFSNIRNMFEGKSTPSTGTSHEIRPTLERTASGLDLI